MRLARRILPDALLVLGVGTVLAGAYLISLPLALIAVGIGLVSLAIWMGV